ncbi:seryl-tRNA synthetase [Ancylobacter novellus DSM 506]|uniref:Serine--tRNA ligase n=1 Tax=Ancylobacter novellus (strain ATCC 8093 / DSM 506 / JCM 20403 / CCM 1077 / IAM 12100 / NBRC 12443 / NCIMB 10456) TaxID=639283 RepID=D6ZZ48_ANCN5|nr:serine--tRNA ligase [Ancylobacter novellus]ADH89184.1 seryl-tRNA synthetase [Ancylobacter novellus DSM 506]
MHDIKWIREEPQGLVEALVRRGTVAAEAKTLVDGLLALDERRRSGIVKLEELQARRNAASKEIGAAKKAGDNSRAELLMAEVAALKTDIPALEGDVKAAEAELNGKLAAIPNAPLAIVPDGTDEHDNVEIAKVGEKRSLAFAPKQHFELGEALGQMDFELAAKLSGARFVVLKNRLARLERAIGQFFIDTHTEEHGYTEVAPPILVNDEAMFGTAQLPKFRNDQFRADAIVEATHDWDYFREKYPELRATWRDILNARLGAEQDKVDGLVHELSGRLSTEDWAALHDAMSGRNLWLIPTAEVPLTNLVRESILSEEELPLRFTALTPCFRAEAGSAGRDTRGMIRQHQFNKVEMVSITTPEASLDEQERMLACAQAVLKKLDLHHRVVTLCTGDMGFASARTFDIEVWLPGQNAYREISSVSTCTDFQARRMNARYRPAGAKQPRFVHTLNGSGVAVGRAMVAILENYQNEDGSVTVPDVLVPYMGEVRRIERA